MTIEFSANASALHRACIRVAARLPKISVDDEKRVHFRVASTRLGMKVDGSSANVVVEAQRAGNASIPFTILAGVAHVLPYFGNTDVEIGFSRGKMRVDNTIFHNRCILVSTSAGTERRRSSFKEQTLQLA